MSQPNDLVLVYGLTSAGDEVPLRVTSNGTLLIEGSSVGGGGSTIDREIVVSTYRVATAFAGASIDDLITQAQIVDVTGTPTTVGVLWRNQTTGLDLASTPTLSNLTPVVSTGLTDAQLRAAAVPVTATALTNLDADVGATSDSAATTDTGTFSLIALVKRGLQNWTTILARIPALVSGRVPVDGSGVTQPVSAIALTNLDADVGATSDAAATTDTGTFSLIALVKRGLQNWTTMLARIPALVSGRMPVDGSGVTQPVSGTVTALGPLTDAQLRAAAVPVSGTVTALGPLTDAQLRAAAVPVSGTVSVSGTVIVPATVIGSARRVAASTGSASVTLTATCRRVNIFARTADIRYAVGPGPLFANSTSHFIAVGERLEFNVPAGSDIAAMRAGTTDGTLEITELPPS